MNVTSYDNYMLINSYLSFSFLLFSMTTLLQVVVYSYFEKRCRKNVHATIPKGNVGYDQYTVSNDCSCRTYFGCFPLVFANICPWPLAPFFQISLENRAD